jgi:hypothetical protein
MVFIADLIGGFSAMNRASKPRENAAIASYQIGAPEAMVPRFLPGKSL